MTISEISPDSQIRLRPLSKQLENGVAIIGWGGQFLELPAEGLHFLTWLDEGLSLAAARQQFETFYAPFSEMELAEVIAALVACDFVAAVDGQVIPPRVARPQPCLAVGSRLRW